MITRLTGKVNGVEVSFRQQVNTCDWVGTIPAMATGVYVVEFEAVDHAGNIAYVTDVVFTVDTSSLIMKVTVSKYGVSVMKELFDCNIANGKQGGGLMELKFLLGENKRVALEVYSTKGDAFVIDHASYTLLLDEQEEDTGDCTIGGNLLYMKISPQTKSKLYSLVVTYDIAGDTFKKKIAVRVE